MKTDKQEKQKKEKVEKSIPQKEDLLKKFLSDDQDSLSIKLRRLIYQTVSDLYGKELKNFNIYEVFIEHPKKEDYGDYSTNVAMVLAGRLREQPMKIAENIRESLNNNIIQHQKISAIPHNKSHKGIDNNIYLALENVNIAGSGFLNIRLNNSFLISQALRLLNEREGVRSVQNTNIIPELLNGKKIMLEFTDPNPFKEFHIGHLYSNSVGESISRLLAGLGADVKGADYFGDVGVHVAKSLYGFLLKVKSPASPAGRQKSKVKTKEALRELEKKPLKERMHFLGECYALGATKYDTDPEAREEMKEINYLAYIAAQEYIREKYSRESQINYRKFVKKDTEQLDLVRELFKVGREWSMQYFESICKRMGTVFDYFYPESMVGEVGMKLVRDGLEKGVFEESEGAVVFRGEPYGLHTRVFINTLGLPTYEAKELGLAPAKYKDFPYDLSVNITGNEINEYFHVVMTAFYQINPELWKKTRHLGHGMVRLPEGKMSSRTGKVVTGEQLLEEVKKRIYIILQKSKSNYKKEEQDEIAEKAAIAAVKYSMLRVGLPSDIVFDIDKSISFDGESGPYLMYTYARCRSVLRKAQKVSSIKYQVFTMDENIKKILNTKFVIHNTEELALLRTLYRFPEVVTEAARNLSPSVLGTFLYDLAKKYNLFYDKHRIITLGIRNKESRIKNAINTDDALVAFRLMLTQATATVLKKGLYLLGVETVERM